MPEDRGTPLTVASLREKCSAGVRRDKKTIGTDVGADTSAVGRRTDEILCRNLPEKRSDFWTAQLHEERTSLEEETTHQQFERVSDVPVVPMDLEQKDWWQ